jgi:hypothetical protein
MVCCTSPTRIGIGSIPDFEWSGVKLPVWLPASLSTITCATYVQMAHARPFWTSTLRDLFNDIKNASIQGVLTPAIMLWIFGSPGGLPSSIFGSANGDLTTPSKWGCDTYGFVSALNLVARKLVGLLRDLQTHKCSYTRTCAPMSVLNLV